MHVRADAAINLTREQRNELEKIARSTRRTSQAVAQRLRIVRMTAAGMGPGRRGQFGVSQPTARMWRARFAEEGLPSLRNEPRPGRPRSLDDQRVADLPNQALQTRPSKQTH